MGFKPFKGLSMTNGVRVVMITYNGDQFFESQIDSILKQTYLDAISIYDDCSKVDFVEKLLKISTGSSKIHLQRNNENLGVIPNIKLALSENHHAPYIALADQDDVWLPEKLEKTYNEMKTVEAGENNIPVLVYHDMKIIDESDNVLDNTFWQLRRQNGFKHSFKTNLISNLVTGSASLMNNALAHFAKDIPENLNIYHDAWLAMVAYSMGRVKCIHEPLSMHRTHMNSLTFNSKSSKNLIQRVIINLKYLIGVQDYLTDQFEFIESFLETYRNNLRDEYVSEFENFLSLRGSNFFKQKKMVRKLLRQQEVLC